MKEQHACKHCSTMENLKTTTCKRNNKTYIENICYNCSYNKYINTKEECDKCHKKFTKPGLKYHIQNQICVEIKCDNCQKQFTKHGLKYHLQKQICVK